MRKKLLTSALVASVIVAGVRCASAQTIVDIPFSKFTTINGSPFASVGTSGNQGTGITFGDWNDTFLGINNTTSTISGENVALSADTVVNTLLQLNTSNSETLTVTFENSLGDLDVFYLASGETIRNRTGGTLSGTGDGVTAQEWATGSSGNHLDAQTFTLPSSWNGTNLQSIVIDSVGFMTLVGAVQVDVGNNFSGLGGGGGGGGGGSGGSYDPGPIGYDSSVPEPISAALLAVGCLALVAMRRRVA